MVPSAGVLSICSGNQCWVTIKREGQMPAGNQGAECSWKAWLESRGTSAAKLSKDAPEWRSLPPSFFVLPVLSSVFPFSAFFWERDLKKMYVKREASNGRQRTGRKGFLAWDSLGCSRGQDEVGMGASLHCCLYLPLSFFWSVFLSSSPLCFFSHISAQDRVQRRAGTCAPMCVHGCPWCARSHSLQQY